MLNKDLIKQEFGYLKDVVYLNTALIGMPPVSGRKAAERFTEDYADTFGAGDPDRFEEKLENAFLQLAKLMKVDRNDLAYTGSTGASVTILANSYPFEPGDNVVISAEEHASNALPWLALENRGVEVRIVESNNGRIDEQTLIDTCDDRTKILSVATVFYCSGYAVDLKYLAGSCREKGIALCVDAIQSLGRLALYPKEVGVDFIAGGVHKGLLGGKSAGYLYCSPELCKKLKPYTGSMQSLKNWASPFSLKHYDEVIWSEGARRFEFGNPPYGIYEMMGEGVRLINELGIENVEAHIREMETVLRGRLKELDLKVIEPEERQRSGLVFVYYPEGADPARVRETLINNRVYATVRGDYIRMSLDLYNDPSQVDQIIYALQQVAAL